jgi:hypothetical protein
MRGIRSGDARLSEKKASIGNWYSALASAAIAWSMFHILWLYRFILFVITMKLV